MELSKYYVPKHLGHGRYGWQCAFADAFCKPYILPGPLWDYLSRPWQQSNSSLYKKYRTKEDAVRALERSYEILTRCLDR